ncbi:hypothetical protein [Natrinema pallidum]|uniref:Envelope protein N-terminal domain-containing protein n=1 Tax=Natrinema pallidum TaxID=69527 RepID=A0A4P9TIK7_9EURY|nr:hypothetical protein [Natrinema pallidum]QCW04739.1 hypothetical protein FGF80_16595 [Natrinema pallidum]
MAAQRPRPTAHRAFSLLLAVLLVGSIVAPIAAAPVAAEDNSMSFEGTCESPLQYVLAISCGHADFADDGIDQDQAASSIEKDIHVGATGIKASQDSTDQLLRNYLQDTDSIASMEARNAFAESYENGESPSVADTRAQAAINDYYSRLQIQVLEETSVNSEQLAYYANVSQNESEIIDGFVHVNAGSTEESYPTGKTVEQDVELANGSVHSVTLPEIHLRNGDEYHKDTAVNVFSDKWEDGRYINIYMENQDGTGGSTAEYYGSVHLLNSGSLESKTVYDYRIARERFDEIGNQSDAVVSNYEGGTAQEFYDALDAGEIEVEDLRGAEGMVRYLSGDANATDDRYQYALRSVLDMNRGSLESTMVVEFEGATDETRVVNETDGSVSYEYNHVNETYEGLLFSSETPTGGFETGVTYNVSDLEGTQKMVTGGPDGDSSDVVFYRGEFEIKEMYDGDGNEINQTDLTDQPEYGTFNATEYLEVMQQAKEDRGAITSDDDTGGGIGLPDNPFDGGGGGGAFVGLVIIGALVVVIAVVVVQSDS